MIIRGVKMDVDVRTELEPYLHMFKRSTDKGSHLNSCSPFRDDNKPSFYVYFEDTGTARAGYWGDHAADDAEFSRGTFLKLLSFLRDESEDETFEYLNSNFGSDAPADINRLGLRKNNRIDFMMRDLIDKATRRDLMDEYRQTHQDDLAAAYGYLRGRGISNETAAQFKIGILDNALAIPWMDARGEMITVKYRDLGSKKFWYMSGGDDITNELFGVHSIYSADIKRLYIVESEIDAMYLHSLGYYAVALGNKAMNRGRAELLRKAPFDELCIIPDNDSPGRFVAESIIEFMSPYKNIFIAEVLGDAKDINDLTPDAVHGILKSAEQLKPLASKIRFKEYKENA